MEESTQMVLIYTQTVVENMVWEQMNDEGERLLNFCAMNNFSVANTVYKQRKNRSVT